MHHSFTLLSRQKCRWIAGTSLAVVAAGSPFIAPAAHAADPGTVVVHVYDNSNGKDLAGQSVQLFSTATGGAVGTKATTDSDGEAVIDSVPNGSYTAKVAGSTAYHEKYSRVVVLDDQPDDGFGDFEFEWVGLQPATITEGKLSGVVTKPDDQLASEILIFPSSATNETIASGEVAPVARRNTYEYDYDGDDVVEADWSLKVAPGSYKVLVTDRGSDVTAPHDPTPENPYNYDDWSERASQVWVGSGATNSASTAKTFSVAAAKVSSVGTAALAADPAPPTTPARISGTVTGTGGIKLDDVEVKLFRQVDEGEGHDGWEEVGDSYTEEDGTFRFDGTWDYNYETGEETFTPLPAGVYTVWYRDDRNEYTSEFNGDKAGEYGYDDVPADVAPISLGETGGATANATLASAPLDKSSGLSGRITDDLGTGHAGHLEIYDVYGNGVMYLQTRRDGTWSIPATELAPGSYKVRADDNLDVAGFYGAKTFKTAKTFTVPVKGAATAGNSNLLRYGSISGKISLAAGPGDATSSFVRLYDQDGEQVDTFGTNAAGAFSIAGTEPGTYFLSANGGRYSSFDESDQGTSWVQYIKQFWKGKFSLGSATPITVGSGGKVTGVNITLGRTLVATSSPTISGPKKVKKGSVLSATPGTWNVGHDVAFGYTWKRGGTVVGSGPTYKVVKADGGKTITLTVTASDKGKEFATGSATSPGVKVAKNKKKKK